MAENVQISMEAMVDEISLLRKYNLFSEEEIRDLVSERTKLKIRIEKTNKTKDDYLRFIRHETDFLTLFKERREKMDIKKKKSASHEMLRLESSIARRIAAIHSDVCKHFRQDASVWMTFVRFCDVEPTLESVLFITVREMLKAHSDKDHLFKITAQWLVDSRKDFALARKIICQGLRLHSSSAILYLEAFRVELKHVDFLINNRKSEAASASSSTEVHPSHENKDDRTENASNSQDESDENTKQNKLAELVFTNAVNKIPNIQMYIDFLNIAEEFKFTYTLQARIVSEMASKFISDEKTWDTLGRRALLGLTTRNDTVESNEASTFRDRVNMCCDVYEAACKEKNTEIMWTYYLERLLELFESKNKFRNFRRNKLINGLNKAFKANKLSENFYLYYVKLLKDIYKFSKGTNTQVIDRRLTTILNRAITTIGSAKIYEHALCHFITLDDEDEIEKLFSTGISKLGDTTECLPLWVKLIQYYQLRHPAKIDDLYIRGICRGPEISSPLKTAFVEYKAMGKGIAAARRIYDTYSILPPFSIEMHLKMIQLEKTQADDEANIKQVRRCFEIALSQFGTDNPDLWLSYVKFEKEKGYIVEMNAVAERAVRTLKAPASDIFLNEYNLFREQDN